MRDGMVLVDADSHVMEPADLWDRYLESRYREDHPMRVVATDEGDVLIIDGAPSRFTRPPALNMINGMGKSWDEVVAQRYVEDSEFGTRDGKERLELMETTGLDYMVLFPSVGLAWNAEVEDPDLALAYARAYNRWVVDFAADAQGRAVPIATIIIEDPVAAAAEVERAVTDGCKGVWLPDTNVSGRGHGNPFYDPFWAKVVELDVPVALHPCVSKPEQRVHRTFTDFRGWARWQFNVCGNMAPQQSLSALLQWGVFDRFPSLRVALIEAGAGWLPYVVHRMDEAQRCSVGSTLRLKEKCSTYFRTNIWVSADADEPGYEHVVEALGSENLFWGSDYPHFDHAATWLPDVLRRTEPLDDHARRNVLGLNALAFWGLPAPVPAMSG